jgi:hypothetical protein
LNAQNCSELIDLFLSLLNGRTDKSLLVFAFASTICEDGMVADSFPQIATNVVNYSRNRPVVFGFRASKADGLSRRQRIPDLEGV